MKVFRCGDVVPNCQATFNADTDEQILSEVAMHASHDHDLAHLSDDLVRAVRGATHAA